MDTNKFSSSEFENHMRNLDINGLLALISRLNDQESNLQDDIRKCYARLRELEIVE